LAERRAGAVVLAVVLTCVPATASADWYFTPFIGYDFGATTTLADFEYRGESRSKPTFGGAAMLMGGIFGIEAEYAFIPRFFQSPNPPDGRPTILESHVQTLTGSFLVAAPLSLTQESLRPYVVAGLGWTDAAAHPVEVLNALAVDSNLTALTFGGGAIGMFGARTGMRFDFRRFTNIDRDEPSGVSFGSPRLSFWRLSVGFTLRY
jgi:hypothetical protein